LKSLTVSEALLKSLDEHFSDHMSHRRTNACRQSVSRRVLAGVSRAICENFLRFFNTLHRPTGHDELSSTHMILAHRSARNSNKFISRTRIRERDTFYSLDYLHLSIAPPFYIDHFMAFKFLFEDEHIYIGSLAAILRAERSIRFSANLS
jgi:hypothetical protein